MSGYACEPWEVFDAGECHGIESLGGNVSVVIYGHTLSDKDEAGVRGASISQAHANAARIVACVNAMAGVDDPVTMMAEIEDVLTRVAEHLDRYSDVNDGNYGEPEANKEMLLLSAIKPLLSRMGGGE